MKKSLRFLCTLLTFLFLLPSSPVRAQTPEEPQISATSAVLYNLETGKRLFEKNMDARLNPAAFTKLMTSLLAFEYRETAGNVSVTVTEEMLSSAGGTSMKLKAGEVISFDSLLSGLVVQNANDAALVIASVVGGNISGFVEMMNARAEKMGMEHTYYANPTGVDSAVMYTTMQDTLLLCETLFRVNAFMVLSEAASVSIPATNLTGERKYTNKNALVPYSYVTDYYMEDVRGMVAGYTPGAGYCVASTRQKGTCTNLVILSGGVDRSEKQNGTDISTYREAKILLEWAENNFSIRKVLPEGKILCERPVRLSAGVDHMILVSAQEWKALLPTDANLDEEVRYEIRTDKETFYAPIIKGEKYGELDLIYNDQIIGTVPLMAQSNIGLSRWLVMWDAVVGFFSQGPAKVVLILAILAAILYVLILIGTVWIHYRRKNRARAQAISEMNEAENKRMKKVRLAERQASQARRRRVRVALREGFRVLSGEAEVMQVPQKGRRPAPSKAVAKVPEKYRRSPQGMPGPGTRGAGARRPGQPPRPRPQGTHPGQRSQGGRPIPQGEKYRTGRPANRKTAPGPQKRRWPE